MDRLTDNRADLRVAAPGARGSAPMDRRDSSSARAVSLPDSDRSSALGAESEVRDIESFDIGIMPLPDDAWARQIGLLLLYGRVRPAVAPAVGAIAGSCRVAAGLLVKSQTSG